MMEEQMPMAAIPKIFYDYITEQPFSKCVCCEKPLLDGSTIYLIEKAIKGSDVLIEYAICLPCAEQKNAAMSQESKERIQAWFEEHVDIEARANRLASQHGFDFEAWTAECIITGKPKADLEHYCVGGMFQGAHMLFGFGPYIMSAEAQKEMSSLLSKQSKDEYDKFIGDNFGLPPELKKLIHDLDFITV
jgi:hypothetical protein